MLNNLKHIWDEAEGKPFTFMSFIIGLLLLLIVKWVSYNLFTITDNSWVSFFVVSLIIPVLAFVFLFLNKSRKSTIAFTVLSIIIFIVSGYEIKKFQKYRYGRKIEDCTIEKSLTEEDFVLIRFKKIKLLSEKFIYEVTNVEEGDDRYPGTTRNSGTSYFNILIPLVDSSYTHKDSIYYFFLVEDDVPLSDKIDDDFFKRRIATADRQKYHYLTIEEDNDLKEYIEENSNGIIVSKNMKFVSILENEEYLLTGNVEKYNEWYNYLQPFMFWLVIYGAFMWFKTD
ncbi:MAG: hypothetical protein H6586_04265 [Flavobacteriales bacterium]|nr:hypothetical protein [Flavobacteriales bacterium]